MNKVLCIYPRKGLYPITRCQDCGYVFECDHCDAALVTYKTWEKNLELICHQCQTYYNYPLECPKCTSVNISSRIGGIEELVEIIERESQSSVYRFDKEKPGSSSTKDMLNSRHAVTTRIFDPAISYQQFTHVVLICAENILASPDYLVLEDSMKNLSELMLALQPSQQLIFDTRSPDLELFQEIKNLNSGHNNTIRFTTWYTAFLQTEITNRQRFAFPPFYNLILLTIQEKQQHSSYENLNLLYKKLTSKKQESFPEITISAPYPARFLRRKGMFSYHVLIKYPKQYPKFSKLKVFIEECTRNLPQIQIRSNPKHLF